MNILESFTEPAIRNSLSYPCLIGLSYPGLVFLTEGLSVVWNFEGCSDYNYQTLQPSQMKRVSEVNGVSSVK